MSRALDKDVKRSALSRGDAAAAFDEITKPFATLPAGGLLDIEILGGSHTLEAGIHLLQDGNAIAIPKLSLVLAFVAARQMLNSHIEAIAPLGGAKLRAATAVILLLDPEHLTAANTRKRLLRSDLSDSRAGDTVIRSEQLFVDSLLTSRLHRHTKSPTLWSHRRWLIKTSSEHGFPVHVVSDLRDVVMVAAERHPRNYYAWCHARYLVTMAAEERQLQSHGSKEEVLLAAKSWCFSHHTDTSGWSFLYFILAADGLARPRESASIFSETIRFARDFRWTNESVWVFLRTMAASGLIDDNERDEYGTACGKLKETEPPDSHALKVIGNAETWYKRYQQPSENATLKRPY